MYKRQVWLWYQNELKEHGEGFGIRQTLVSNLPGIAVADYVTDELAELAKGGQPVINYVGPRPWPMGKTEKVFPRVTTGGTVAARAENTDLTGTNLVTDTVKAVPRMFAGLSTLTQESIDFSDGADDVTGETLYEDLYEKKSAAFWAGAGAPTVDGICLLYTSPSPRD